MTKKTLPERIVVSLSRAFQNGGYDIDAFNIAVKQMVNADPHYFISDACALTRGRIPTSVFRDISNGHIGSVSKDDAMLIAKIAAQNLCGRLRIPVPPELMG